MRRVALETPYRARSVAQRQRYDRYLRAAALDCLRRSEAPFASHGIYPHWLDDDDPIQRDLGIRAGLVWGLVADAAVIYRDLGVTPGMVIGIEAHRQRGIPVELRELGPEWDAMP